MSSIAQRLCDEIVEPTYSPQHTNEPSSSQYNHRGRSHDGKATRSIVIEKKKVVNKLGPSTNPSKSIVNQYKSKEILMNRRLRDMAVNTLKSGPLSCDHDCNTMVRKKDCNNKTCRCNNNKNPSKINVKETQTGGRYDFTLTDNKACAQSIETYTRGTQFAESLSSGIMAYTGFRTTAAKPLLTKPEDSQSIETYTRGTQFAESLSSGVKACTGFGTTAAKALSTKPEDSQCIKCRMIPVTGEHACKSLCSYSNKAIKCPKYSYMGARRWALSKYPSRGPDF